MRRGDFFWGLAAFLLAVPGPALAAPIASAARVVAGTPVQVVAIDLKDPATVLDVVLAGDRPAVGPPRGQAPFSHFIRKSDAAAVINGTFFSMDAQKRLMGTMVQSGRLVNHVSFRPHGTTFGLLPGNRPEMVPAGQADWRRYWMSVTAGPRLLTDGRVVLNPRAEGFTDPAVVRPATRTALGVSRDGATLWWVSFPTAVSLEREARVLRALGAYQALNLDGGTCRSLAERGRVRAQPGRPLTNAIAVYDRLTPAPESLRLQFAGFRRNTELPPPLLINGRRFDPGPFSVGRKSPPKTPSAARPYSFEDWLFTPSAGRSTLHNYDGWLELNGAGVVSAAWPSRPGRDFTLELMARRIGTGFGLHLGRGKEAPWLELRGTAPTGFYLRQGSRLLASRAGAVDRDRHLYSFEHKAGHTTIRIDGRLLFTVALTPSALGVSGGGAIKGLTLLRP